MNKYITLGCLSALLYTSTAFAEYRADTTTRTVSYNNPIYVSRTAPILTELATIDLGTMYGWTWWNITGPVQAGIYLPGYISASSPKVGSAYVRELGGLVVSVIPYTGLLLSVAPAPLMSMDYIMLMATTVIALFAQVT